MNPTLRLSLVLAAGVALLAGAGCATSANAVRNPSQEQLVQAASYDVPPSPMRIDAAATVSARVTEDESIKRYLATGAHLSAAAVENHPKALAQVLINDVTRSNMFTRILPVGDPQADYIVTIQDDESRYPDWIVRITLEVRDAKTGEVLAAHTQEMAAGMKPYKDVFLPMMVELRTAVMNDLVTRLRQKTLQAATASFQKASLTDLLAASDGLVVVARERNRAIIAAKDRQLPEILRTSKTDDLTALVVKIEQTVLDLNHNSEMAKDRAQQMAAANGNAAQISDLRELAICYRERIELLKPIAAAIREEIANRNR